MTAETVADVFIIESLRVNDEIEQRYEGRRLADILRMAGKNPKYFYFQEKKELPHILQIFKESKYRFLHFSCHATLSRIITTRDFYTYPEFAQELKGVLKLRRAFFSACELGNQLFSTCLAGTNKGMHSITAPAEEIRFDHAAAIWSSLYVSIFTSGKNNVTHGDVVKRLKMLGTLFPVDLHFSGYDARNDSWEHSKIHKSSIAVPGPAKGNLV
ncbi:hypothetical protein M2D07_006395 [Pseudomonas sp. BGr12]|uniref:hypothetical protein n=1 Tax=Pseudomonas sp. BGr12 TaxID=2936269 RepID=UPI0025596693|nr:hypothetical protein [Pseudomonas sp. BJa5]MDL2426647.1 hypothetical protein [Pseudomonas sp. BJa5]